MRFSLSVCAYLAGLCAVASPSTASVVISNAATQSMTCSGGTCSPTAPDAVLNVQDLENMLASGNTSVTTTGSGVEARDIRVNASLQWSAATLLQLEVFHSVDVNRKVAVRGSGSVWLIFNGTGGEFACNDKGAITFASASSRFSINQTSYTLVTSIASLASAIAANPSGAFALAKGYNAGKDGTYVAPPIPTVFSGSFNGLGNTISNLSINDPTENAYVGLFAETATGSAISNIRLVNENVTGGSGSSIGNSTEYVGGLVGWAEGGTITHSVTSGTITAGDYSAVGGVVGFDGGGVNASASSAMVSDGIDGAAGGLAGGTNSAAVSDSSATGSVFGSGFVGGLVGFNSFATIERSSATGNVSGMDDITYSGGLVGINADGVVDRSYASGTVTCQYACGGLVGVLGMGAGGTATIAQSFATGSVSANGNGNVCTGGLVGLNYIGAEISNSYATGASNGTQAGGLVCQNINGQGYHAISDSYSAGEVTASEYAGGLLGADEFASTLKHTYWDMTTSGITDPSEGAGDPANDPGIKGLGDKKLKSGLPKGFNPKIWNEDSNINGGLPYLIANPPAN